MILASSRKRYISLTYCMLFPFFIFPICAFCTYRIQCRCTNCSNSILFCGYTKYRVNYPKQRILFKYICTVRTYIRRIYMYMILHVIGYANGTLYGIAVLHTNNAPEIGYSLVLVVSPISLSHTHSHSCSFYHPSTTYTHTKQTNKSRQKKILEYLLLNFEFSSDNHLNGASSHRQTNTVGW